MEKVPTISVIIPVYNVEKYLRRCLDSIASQTFSDWECILIDDGSPDGSGAICDEYAAKDARFRVIHQANAGVSAARNAGLDAARGEWITFVDSDDWIEAETYALCYERAISDNADIVAFGIRRVYDDGKQEDVPFNHTTTENDFLLYKVYMHAVWNKLFHNTLLHNLFHTGASAFNDDIIVAEDLVFSFKCASTAKKVSYIDEKLYNYFVRQGSATNSTYSKEKVDSMLNVYTQLSLFCKEHSLAYPKFLKYWNAHCATSYLLGADFFAPDVYRRHTQKWNFSSLRPDVFIVELCAFLHIDIIPLCYVKAKAVIKKMLHF